MTTVSNQTSQSIVAGGQILLPNINVQKGCNTKAGNNGVIINKAGLYDVEAFITGLVIGGGIINLAVQVNGETVGYLTGEAYSNTGEPATVTVAGPIEINPNCCAVKTNVPAVVTLVNDGANVDVLSSATLSVTKVC